MRTRFIARTRITSRCWISLQFDAFMPLHYELFWLMGKVTLLAPRIVRILPAVFGTAMVPGMYLLASHLVRRRTALVVALVTACSAYMLGYSRDGKMYMLLWCSSVYSAGCLLWWFRTGVAGGLACLVGGESGDDEQPSDGVCAGAFGTGFFS